MTTGTIEIEATTLDALHHGAGSSGNTSLLRTQEIALGDGTHARVPWVSGSSFKHTLRDAAARHAIAVMGIEEGTLSKAVVDLLFSGGHLNKSGAAVNLARARELEELFPALMLGYSAGNTMRASRVHVDNFHLVCAENVFRAPSWAREDVRALKRASAFRGEEFGTRHEASRQPHVSRMLIERDRRRLEASAAEKLAKAEERKKAGKKKGAFPVKEKDKGDSSQMLFDFQTVLAGARLFGAIHFFDLRPLELAALKCALATACAGGDAEDGYVFYLGAKRSVGWGRTAMRFRGVLRQLPLPPSAEDAELSRVVIDEDYEAHLRANRDAILGALHGAVT